MHNVCGKELLHVNSRQPQFPILSLDCGRSTPQRGSSVFLWEGSLHKSNYAGLISKPPICTYDILLIQLSSSRTSHGHSTMGHLHDDVIWHVPECFYKSSDITKIAAQCILVVVKWHIMQVGGIGDFRVAFRLCFKASSRVKPFIWKLVLFTCKWTNIYMWITNFHMKGFARTRIRFETEATGLQLGNRLTRLGRMGTSLYPVFQPGNFVCKMAIPWWTPSYHKEVASSTLWAMGNAASGGVNESDDDENEYFEVPACYIVSISGALFMFCYRGLS